MEQVIEICVQLIAVLFGSNQELLYALVLFVILDYIAGICAAIHNELKIKMERIFFKILKELGRCSKLFP